MKDLIALTEKIANSFLHVQDEEKVKTLAQAIRFALVGVSNTVLAYVLYAVSLYCFRNMHLFGEYAYLASQAVSFILSVLWSFCLNRSMVFVDHHRSLLGSLIRTYCSYAITGLFLSSALLIVWIKVLHVPEMIAPLLNLVITVPLNFLLNKYWAFKS